MAENYCFESKASTFFRYFEFRTEDLIKEDLIKSETKPARF